MECNFVTGSQKNARISTAKHGTGKCRMGPRFLWILPNVRPTQSTRCHFFSGANYIHLTVIAPGMLPI